MHAKKKWRAVDFGTEKVSRLLLRLAPPVMLAQLIQALYNIVDSYFIGRYSVDVLAALSVIFPVQLLMTALAIGIGVGVNTVMARADGTGRSQEADRVAGVGVWLALLAWVVFAAVTCAVMPLYARVSLSAAAAQAATCSYGRIVCGCSIGIFLESNWTKVLQARGNMRLPMVAQIVGAGVNIGLDRLLIFGAGPIPRLGVAGAAWATVIGQVLAACIVGVAVRRPLPPPRAVGKYVRPICKAGVPNMLMNALCTVYIIVLNLILASFSDDAVTVLGLYYKMQTFLLIPVLALTTCIVPLLSFNYAAGAWDRCRSILWQSVGVSAGCMAVGTVVFWALPTQLLSIFAAGEPGILALGTPALRIIAIGFVPIVWSLIVPTYFQAIGKGGPSMMISVLRQILLLIPLAWGLSFLGVQAVWWAFPITEYLTAGATVILYKKYPMPRPAQKHT